MVVLPAEPRASRMTRLAARLCIRFDHLPRRRWLYDCVMTEMFTPFAGADPRNPEAVSGVLNVRMATPKSLRAWMDWWRDMQ